MCSPAFMLIGGVMQGVSSIMAGNAQGAGLDASAAYNKRQAQIERDKGIYEAGLKADEGARVLSKQRTGFARMGISGASGSAIDVAADTGRSIALDVAAIRYGAKIKSENYMYQAKIDKMNAGLARTGGVIGAIAPIINAAGTSFTSSYG